MQGPNVHFSLKNNTNGESHDQYSYIYLFLAFFLYATLLLIISLPSDLDSPLVNTLKNNLCPEIIEHCDTVATLPAKATARDYLTFYGYADAGSYVRGALLLIGMDDSFTEASSPTHKLSTYKRLKYINTMGFGMWPPGMFILNAAALSISIDIKLGIFHAVVTTVFWATAFCVIAFSLSRFIRWQWTILPPLLIVPFPLFHEYMLQNGIPYSETYSGALMVIAFTLLLTSAPEKDKKYNTPLMVSGLVFSISCLLRSQMLPVAVGVSLVLIGSHAINHFQKNKSDNAIFNFNRRSIFLFLIALYIPLFSYMAINRGALFHADYMWEYPYKIAKYPDAGVANFVAQGGMRAACEVDLARCNILKEKLKIEGRIPKAKQEVMAAFLSHPISFMQYKLPIAWNYWLEVYDQTNSHMGYIWIWNAIILSIATFSMLFAFYKRLFFFLSISIITTGFIIAPPLLLHFESRYFYLLKIFFILSPLWLYMLLKIKTQMQTGKDHKNVQKHAYQFNPPVHL